MREPECGGCLPVSFATFSFAGQAKKGVFDQDGDYSVDFDLYDLLPSSTPYSGVTIVLNVVFGEYKKDLSYSVMVEKTASFDDDGDKGDCVRIAGIDWAKGNLVCDNGKWTIGDQTDLLMIPRTPPLMEHFSVLVTRKWTMSSMGGARMFPTYREILTTM